MLVPFFSSTYHFHQHPFDRVSVGGSVGRQPLTAKLFCSSSSSSFAHVVLIVALASSSSFFFFSFFLFGSFAVLSPFLFVSVAIVAVALSFAMHVAVVVLFSLPCADKHRNQPVCQHSLQQKAQRL